MNIPPEEGQRVLCSRLSCGRPCVCECSNKNEGCPALLLPWTTFPKPWRKRAGLLRTDTRMQLHAHHGGATPARLTSCRRVRSSAICSAVPLRASVDEKGLAHSGQMPCSPSASRTRMCECGGTATQGHTHAHGRRKKSTPDLAMLTADLAQTARAEAVAARPQCAESNAAIGGLQHAYYV